MSKQGIYVGPTNNSPNRDRQLLINRRGGESGITYFGD